MCKSPVFISYSSKDRALARRIATFIRRRGRIVWLDERDIAPGDQLAREIAEALATAAAVVVVVSRFSMRSKWLRYEVATVMPRVISGDCRLIPIRTDTTKVAPELRGLLYVDLRNRRRGYAELARGLELPRSPVARAQATSSHPSTADLRRSNDERLRAKPTRGNIICRLVNSVFDASYVWGLPLLERETLDFTPVSRGHYDDAVEFYYEAEDAMETADSWRVDIALDEDYSFRLLNHRASGSESYYALLIADRPVRFRWGRRVAGGKGRLQVRSWRRGRGEPARLEVAVDLSGVKSIREMRKYCVAARAVFARDRERWHRECGMKV